MNTSPWEPGHFYSPIPNDEDIDRAIAKKRSFRFPSDLKVDVESIRQNLEQLLDEKIGELKRFLVDFPKLYPVDSKQFILADAIVLFGLIEKNKPKRIVEVGSGHSSAFMLDVRSFLNLDFEIVCVEPFPQRLRETLGERIHDITLYEMPVQEMHNEFWRELDENCLLFIDSSHVAKAGSDVNFLFFEVLPNLNKGCFVHIHDIFSGFEYPEKWLREGRSWNEAYLLRAFLMFNQVFSIYLWPQATRNNELFEKICTSTGLDVKFPGSSIYLEKVQ
jgi:hypothetical protein